MDDKCKYSPQFSNPSFVFSCPGGALSGGDLVLPVVQGTGELLAAK